MPKLHQQLRRLCSWVRKKYRMLAYRRSMSLTGRVGVSTSLPVVVVMVVAAVAAVGVGVGGGVLWGGGLPWGGVPVGGVGFWGCAGRGTGGFFLCVLARCFFFMVVC